MIKLQGLNGPTRNLAKMCNELLEFWRIERATRQDWLRDPLNSHKFTQMWVDLADFYPYTAGHLALYLALISTVQAGIITWIVVT